MNLYDPPLTAAGHASYITPRKRYLFHSDEHVSSLMKHKTNMYWSTHD